MAKAKANKKGKTARNLKTLEGAVAKALENGAQHEQPVQPASQIREVLVVTGGTADKPVRENAASYPPVTPQEIAQYGNDRKRVVTGLAMNILGGIALSREVLNKESEAWALRSLRTDKMAFFKILECNLTREQICDAWEQTLKDRKRYDAPTLQALSKAVRAYKILSGQLEARVSPMEKFARDCLAVLNNRALTQDEILRQIRTKLNEKANYDAESPAPAVRAAA